MRFGTARGPVGLEPKGAGTGIDGSAAAVHFAERQFGRDNLAFRVGLVDEIELPDASVDGIAFLEVVEHMPRAQAAEVFRTFHRLLRPRGRLVVSTPNLHSLWPVIEWTLDRIGLVPHLAGDQHVQMYTRGTLEGLARETGFRQVGHRTLNTLAPWLAPLSWRLADAVHRLEQAWVHPFGSLLLSTFLKDQ